MKLTQSSTSTHTPQTTKSRCALKLNPVADWMKRKNIVSGNKEHNSGTPNPKQGPFFKQQQKLEKAKRVEDKKQKSKKAKSATKGKKALVSDVIELLSSDESDNSDVVVIPIPPPPTFIVDDSDEDEKIKVELKNSSIMQEENALDSTDVQMTESSSFIKPQSTASQTTPMIVDSCSDKRLDNSSRCTSPCSIQSSDDFIGHIDRSRLLEAGSGIADDEDLLLLTTDVNSLLEAPQKHTEIASKNLKEDDQDNSRNKSADDAEIANDSSEFTTPKSSGVSYKVDYRVEQPQFRALDVYESESDITDSVYSKGVPKTTVIRHVDTSSDEIEDISSVTTRTKRLRKRRASSSNKGSDVNNENTLSSSENSNDDDNGANRTAIPFISRGPAVERRIRKNSRTLSACSPAPSKPSKSTVSKGHMSDGDFIAKLNNLVQGQDEENEAEESDEAENAPSAREIAEKVLSENTETVATKDAIAIPKDVCSQLNDVFSTIDKMEEKEQENNAKEQRQIEKTDHSRGTQKKSIVYKSLPYDTNTQIITYVADERSNSTFEDKLATKRSKNGSPIYNVVYMRGTSTNGGIGWNNEMRKFYGESWKGEDFVVSDIWRKMNRKLDCILKPEFL